MSVRIGLGVANFPFSNARAFWRWVELCEQGGVDSIWQTDRLATALPMLEPMSLMAALAGATERLKFGMNVIVVPFRDPLVLARECATIDYLSDGRLLPAFGVGRDVAPEWGATGRSAAGRGKQADEALEIMSRLWAEERVTFEGEHYRYRDASIAPRPAQRPMPLWIGGSSKAAIRRTVRLGTGWLGGVQSPAQVAPVVEAIKRKRRTPGARSTTTTTAPASPTASATGTTRSSSAPPPASHAWRTPATPATTSPSATRPTWSAASTSTAPRASRSSCYARSRRGTTR